MNPGMAEQKEARAAARKVLRCPARVLLSDTVVVKGRTMDVSMAGVSVMLDEPIPVSRLCTLIFDAPINGKIVKINVAAKAVYCTCVGTSGFRVGMQFSQQDQDMAKLIRQLLL